MSKANARKTAPRQMSDEARYLSMMTNNLSAAIKSGDRAAEYESLDDLEIMLRLTGSRIIKRRCYAAIKKHAPFAFDYIRLRVEPAPEFM